MQAKQRYILLFLSCAFLALCYFGGYRLKGLSYWMTGRTSGFRHSELECFMEPSEVMGSSRAWASSPKQDREEARITASRSQCRMETCFDFSRCLNGFRVYIHPPDENVAMSSTYRKIINVISESR